MRVFTPDGRRLVTGTAEKLQLWDVDGGRELCALTRKGGEKPFPKDLVASPDGRHVLGSSGPFTEVVLFDLATGHRTVLAPFAGFCGGGPCGQFAPDGRLVAIPVYRPANTAPPFLLGPPQVSTKVIVWDVETQAER